jgi:hypothetical protein
VLDALDHGDEDAAMTRETLEAILAIAPGSSLAKPDKKSDEKVFVIAEEHRASIHLALGTSSMSLIEIARIALGNVLRIELRDRTVMFVEYSAVQGFSVKPPRGAGPDSRTGF